MNNENQVVRDRLEGALTGLVLGKRAKYRFDSEHKLQSELEEPDFSELQNLYEAILEVKFDRRNFYNKMLKLGILSEAEPRPANASRRTPSKYRFNAEKYAELKQKGFRLEF